MRCNLVLCLVAVAHVPLLVGPAGAQSFVYKSMCDASAAVALDADHFVVATDELNRLRIYHRGHSDAVKSVDVSKFLGTKEDKESDLEGAARIGNRIYWISSHGTNSEGKQQERRRRFFATDITSESGVPTVAPVGNAPYTELLADLIAAPQLASYGLEKASTIPPKTEGGLNIEALAATPEGKLLIGFRNPVGVKGALVVPLENPGEVIEGKAARFGDAIPVDLSGRGIRSMERVGDSYLIVGGPVASGGTFMLYRWSGRKDDKPSEIEGIDFKGMSPEALFAVPQTNKIQILSDDGSEPVGSKECKDLDASKQSFRSLIITP